MDGKVTENFEMPAGLQVEDERSIVEAVTTEHRNVVVQEAEEFVAPERPIVNRPFFAIWEVGGKKYRLKLKTAGIQAIEQKYKQNMLMFLNDMPSLSFMLEVVHEAMVPWHKGVKIQHVQALYDKYIEDGGSNIAFWRDVFIEVYKASGFFTQEMLQNMAEENQNA
ncbi:MAG: hypothetical protein UF228_06635 [Lachnospiraceae bacterium]|nr:hypothetical protein [Lachnospiraceae bacterium]